MSEKFILSLDQGTTSSRAILFDDRGVIRESVQREFRQIYPRAGWVEHDPADIWCSQRDVMHEVLEKAGISPRRVHAIGITNQRETALIWDRETGEPVHNAIVWQCRRTASICDDLKERGLAEHIRSATGLVVDAYFSGTKIAWLLENVPGVRRRAEAGELAFGTVDAWLVWNLTGGRLHVTDATNASRTMLYDIARHDWDETILSELRIPRAMLPEVRSSSEAYGTTAPGVFEECEVPIASIAGDQHAALFGQVCFEPGMVKNTYGTGCFVVMNTGCELVRSGNGLLSTIAWQIGGETEYALEGSIFVAGAAVQWLRDEVGLIESASETEGIASQVPDAGGAYFVPAFVGLGAPYWDMYARGGLFGLTRGVDRRHIVRAVLESIAYQSRDVLDALRADSGLSAHVMRADGGACVNDFLMQFQADILGLPVSRPVVTETTALGAAYLAGLATGFWSGKKQISEIWREQREFTPKIDDSSRSTLYAGWKRAVERAGGWIEPGAE
ncbi:MAG: glycerol kinase [Spirochaetaceae bacterium]|nr:MAG: glycerol kinase [Spirochaetaceae bacterium]